MQCIPIKMQCGVTCEKTQNIAVTYYNIYYTKCEKNKIEQVWCHNK
jgi:hypothetical protein